MDLSNLDWTPLARLMTLAGIRRLEFALHKHKAELAVLEYEEIVEDQAPMYPGMQGVFAVFNAPDFEKPASDAPESEESDRG